MVCKGSDRVGLLVKKPDDGGVNKGLTSPVSHPTHCRQAPEHEASDEAFGQDLAPIRVAMQRLLVGPKGPQK